MTVSTARLSTKGQLVIPAEVRERQNLKEGDELYIIEDGDEIRLVRRVEDPVEKFYGVTRGAWGGAREIAKTIREGREGWDRRLPWTRRQ